jgi:drug/metabolite transporter (DMT)-like permease
MTVLLSLLAAVSVGTSDFLGGLASRRADSTVVTAVSNLVGFVLAGAVALMVGGTVTLVDVAWGVIGGAAVSFGLVALYTGYARARVSIAAPVAGVGAAALPVIVETATGNQELSGLTTVGIVLGLVAIGLVSVSDSDDQGSVRTSLFYGLGGALGIGSFFLCLAQTSDESELWPIVTARASGFVVLIVVVAATGMRLRLERAAMPTVVGIAVLVTAGNTAFLAATRVGSTSVAAVVTSLFPAVTVFWAWLVFRERLRAVQLVGLAVALVAVAFIAAG